MSDLRDGPLFLSTYTTTLLPCLYRYRQHRNLFTYVFAFAPQAVDAAHRASEFVSRPSIFSRWGFWPSLFDCWRKNIVLSRLLFGSSLVGICIPLLGVVSSRVRRNGLLLYELWGDLLLRIESSLDPLPFAVRYLGLMSISFLVFIFFATTCHCGRWRKKASGRM
jgi:hypothetical protein